MANISIESAFIEDWNKAGDPHPAWGAKTAEPHRRKDESGQYQTVARTFRTVKVSRDSGIDLTVFRKGDRVRVVGREVTEVREHDGKKYYDLVCWADVVERVDAVDRGSAPVSQPNDTWSGGGAGGFDSTPF